jgi:hypothetical protein
MVKFFLTKYLLYDFLLRYGGEVFPDEVFSVWFLTKMVVKFFLKDEVSSVWSLLAGCRSSGIQSEVVCSYMCLCYVINIVFTDKEIG